MSRESERLLEAMNDLPEETLEEAAAFRPRKAWQRHLTHAALVMLAVGLSGSWFLATRGCGSGGGGGSKGDDSNYLYYAGPNLPLTLARADPEITADRHLTLDFLPSADQWREDRPEGDISQETLDALQAVYDHWDLGDGSRPRGTYSDLLLVDRYTLTNEGATDKRVEALYPVPASLGNLAIEQPLLWVEGMEQPQDLVCGAYAGPNYVTWPESDERVAVSWPEDWRGWVLQLEDGANLDRALAPFGTPEPIPVTVYRFTDPAGPAETEEVPNPSIRVSFELDYDQTAILPMGFQSMHAHAESGTMTLGFSIPQPGEPDREEAQFLVLGQPIENLSVQGYITGGSDPDTPTLAGCTVTVEEEQSDLYTELLAMLRRQDRWRQKLTLPDAEARCKLLWRELEPMLDRPADLWTTNWMELTQVFLDRPRLVWGRAEVTIPAGDSVDLTVLTRREGSLSAGDRQDSRSYDFLPTAGSNLTFTSQAAALEDRDAVVITAQSFGFDPENGVTEVALDLSQPRYFLQVEQK